MSVKTNINNQSSSGYGKSNNFLPNANIIPIEGFDTLMGQNLYMDYIRAGESTETDKTVMYFQVFSETATISSIEFKKGNEWKDISDIYGGVELMTSSAFYGEHRNITVDSGVIIVYYKK